MTRAQEAMEAASRWDDLATDADRMGDWERDNGRFDGVYRNKAATYRDVAKSLRMEAQTGVPHCVCCFKPTCCFKR